MFDYRLFFANSTLEGTERSRRTLLGHDPRRVYRIEAGRREPRGRGRR